MSSGSTTGSAAALVEGTSGRSGPVFNPATGAQTGAVDFATPEEIDLAVQAAKEAFQPWRGSRSRSGRALLPDPRALPRAARGARAHPDGRARQGALGRDGRGRARARGDRVLLRHPDAAQGRLLRAGLDGDRRLLDPPAARRRRRDHAVQLPRDGARCGCGRRRSRAATRSCSSRPRRIRPLRCYTAELLNEAGRSGGSLQRRARRQGRGRLAARASRHRGGLVRRLDADREVRLRDGDRSTGSGSRLSAGRRTT